MLDTTKSPNTAPVLDAERLHVYAVADVLGRGALAGSRDVVCVRPLAIRCVQMLSRLETALGG